MAKKHNDFLVSQLLSHLHKSYSRVQQLASYFLPNYVFKHFALTCIINNMTEHVTITHEKTKIFTGTNAHY